MPVADIDTGSVLLVLQPIWHEKTMTASRVRNRIELVLDYAKVGGHHGGENPARWRGHLDKMLLKKSKIETVEHHAALPHREIAAFMTDLRALDDQAARALELAILCVSRTAEVLEAFAEVLLAQGRAEVGPRVLSSAAAYRPPATASGGIARASAAS